MRIRVILVVAAVVAMLFAGGSAPANDACATVTVTTPTTGTITIGPACAPTPFTHSITSNSCGGSPPLGESHCVRLVLQTPL